MKSKKRKKFRIIKKICIILIILAIPPLLLIYHCRLQIYTDFNKYLKAGGHDYFSGYAYQPFNYKCAYQDVFFARYQAYSFYLSEEDFDSFINEVAEDEFHISKSGYSCSSYYEYKYHGIKVGEINELNYINSPYYGSQYDTGTLNDFNDSDFVNNVTDKPIDDYTVILYHPQGPGTRSSGLFADPETNRIVYYQMSSIR